MNANDAEAHIITQAFCYRFVFFLNTDPLYDALREDAQFDAIAKSVGVRLGAVTS